MHTEADARRLVAERDSDLRAETLVTIRDAISTFNSFNTLSDDERIDRRRICSSLQAIARRLQ